VAVRRSYTCPWLSALLALTLSGPLAAEELGVRAQLVAAREAVLSSDLAARVLSVPRKPGEAFGRGEPLARLDCSLYEAQLAKAKAQLLEASKVHAVNKNLDQYGSISLLEIEVSEARLGAARAEADLMAVAVSRCEVSAPFAGKLVEAFVDPHQYVAEGQQLLAIVDDSRLDVEMIVPSSWLAWLRPGAAFEIRVDETGGTYAAVLRRISPQVDAVSQSVKVYGALEARPPELMVGMSGFARFASPQDEAP